MPENRNTRIVVSAVMNSMRTCARASKCLEKIRKAGQSPLLTALSESKLLHRHRPGMDTLKRQRDYTFEAYDGRITIVGPYAM